MLALEQTQFECWLAFQHVGEGGLRPATDEEIRVTIVTIYNANELMARGLRSMWSHRTPAETVEVLSKPDVTVTNESDKQIQLGKLLQLDERVRRA